MATVQTVNEFNSHDVSGWNSAFVRWIAVEIFFSISAVLGVFIYENVAKEKFISREFESDESKSKEKKYEVGEFKGDLPSNKSDKDGKEGTKKEKDEDKFEFDFDDVESNKKKEDDKKEKEKKEGKKDIPVLKNKTVNALDEVESQMLDKPLAPEHDALIYLFLHIVCVGMALHLSDSIFLIFLGFIHFLIFVGYLVLHVSVWFVIFLGA